MQGKFGERSALWAAPCRFGGVPFIDPQNNSLVPSFRNLEETKEENETLGGKRGGKKKRIKENLVKIKEKKIKWPRKNHPSSWQSRASKTLEYPDPHFHWPDCTAMGEFYSGRCGRPSVARYSAPQAGTYVLPHRYSPFPLATLVASRQVLFRNGTSRLRATIYASRSVAGPSSNHVSGPTALSWLPGQPTGLPTQTASQRSRTRRPTSGTGCRKSNRIISSPA